MNLRTLSMLPDDIGPLGPPIRREQTKPAPAPTVEHRPDGTLTTNPDGTMSFEPRVAESLPQPVWTFPTSPKEDPEPGAHGFMREPLKVGDRVRYIGTADYPVMIVRYASSDGLVCHEAHIGGVGRYFLAPTTEGITWDRV